MNINNNKKKYKLLEKVAIADIAYEAYGRNLNELFENSAFAIFEMMVDLKTVDAKKKLKIKLDSENIENLLYDFLSEILFLKDSKYMVFNKSKVLIKKEKNDESYKLNAVLEGDRINPKKQKLENDIKAVTMHMFKMEKIKNDYKATIVVDI